MTSLRTTNPYRLLPVLAVSVALSAALAPSARAAVGPPPAGPRPAHAGPPPAPTRAVVAVRALLRTDTATGTVGAV
jgi:hypothetical protein